MFIFILLPLFQYSVTRGYGFHFIPLGNYLLQNIMLFLLISIFVIVVAIVISLYIKNTFSLFVSVIMIIIGGVIGSNKLTNLAHLSPFTYFDIQHVTNGKIVTVLDNPAVNTNTGFIVLAVLIIILILIGTWISRKH